MTGMPGELSFGSKAETLERLYGLLKTAEVLPQYRFTAARWWTDRVAVLTELETDGWLSQTVIVRSSACGEDSREASHAGEFETIPYVHGLAAVEHAIDRVFASYGRTNPNDQVFLQPQLMNSELNGVAFGLDPHTGGPYVVMNYAVNGRIGVVTEGGETETFTWFKGAALPADHRLAAVIVLQQELERLFGTPALDIEFAWANGRLYLLQGRLLACFSEPISCIDGVSLQLQEIARRLTATSSSDTRRLGTGILLGVMPDWNPAEMIGLRPRPLAASLYRHCLTDTSWAEQRFTYGYRDLRGCPLMQLLEGQPYIDVRASFTSFIPASLPDRLADKLVEHYVTSLRQHPELHDKIELDLVLHCWSFDLPQRLDDLRKAGFDSDECAVIRSALGHLTAAILGPSGPWKEDCRRLADFEKWLDGRTDSEEPDAAELWQLLEQCRRAACAFAGVARAGFMAVTLLRSLVSISLWSEEDEDRFMRSLKTVTSQMRKDRQQMPNDQFLQRYGHLRPGTYDITAPRYDEAPEHYFPESLSNDRVNHEEFCLDSGQRTKLSRILQETPLGQDLDTFLQCLREAIEARESGKFVYSRGISEFLRLWGRYGAKFGLSLDDCAEVDLTAVKRMAQGADPQATLQESITTYRVQQHMWKGVSLPPLILSQDDLWSFHLPRYQPNFITRGIASGPLRRVPTGAPQLEGCILLLPSADPGYDWIFAAGIAGFITMYGGANSHMAIRSRELNIPAAIGIGEPRYQKLAMARAVRIDGLNQQLVVLS